MNDHDLWLHGIEQCKQHYDSLKPAIRQQCDLLLEKIMHCKTELMQHVTLSGSDEHCRKCGGKCCLYGKYHVTPVEILAHIHNGTTLPAPDFTSYPLCPYSNAFGCLMTVELRPTTCIIFNCDELETGLSIESKITIEMIEKELRGIIAELTVISGITMTRPLLLGATDKHLA